MRGAQRQVAAIRGLDALRSGRVVFDAIIGAWITAPSVWRDRRFAGLFRDGEAGLDSPSARPYGSRTGRFSTVDPIYSGLFEPQGWNRYAYALKNPISFVDTTGMQVE